MHINPCLKSLRGPLDRFSVNQLLNYIRSRSEGGCPWNSMDRAVPGARMVNNH